MHHYQRYECQQCILMMNPNRLPSLLGHQNSRNRILLYLNIYEYHDNWEYVEYDMIYRTKCQSHKKSAMNKKKKKNKLNYFHFCLFRFPECIPTHF